MKNVRKLMMASLFILVTTSSQIDAFFLATIARNSKPLRVVSNFLAGGVGIGNVFTGLARLPYQKNLRSETKRAASGAKIQIVGGLLLSLFSFEKMMQELKSEPNKEANSDNSDKF